MAKDRGLFIPIEDARWQEAATEVEKPTLLDRLAAAVLRRTADEATTLLVISNRFEGFHVLLRTDPDQPALVTWIGFDKDLQDKLRYVGGRIMFGDIPTAQSFRLTAGDRADFESGEIKPRGSYQKLGHPDYEIGHRLLNHITQVAERGHVNQDLTARAREIAGVPHYV